MCAFFEHFAFFVTITGKHISIPTSLVSIKRSHINLFKGGKWFFFTGNNHNTELETKEVDLFED